MRIDDKKAIGGRTGMLAESHSPYETGGGRLCSRQVGEATTRRVKWAWGGPYGPSWGPLGLMPDTSMPTPPAAHQLGRADKHETVSREGIGITFL